LNFTQHPSNNAVFGAPKGWDQQELPCGALPVTKQTIAEVGPVMVSFWRPSDEEILQLARGGLITLWIHGEVHPVVGIGVEPPK
jgi:hypothetical protein